MDESEKTRFEVAERLWRSGRINDAIQLHLDLCLNGRDAGVRLWSAMAVVDRLKFSDAPEKLLEVCTVGSDCAKELSDSARRALFMAKKAEYLATFTGLNLTHRRKRLRMAPGWFAFGLASEEQLFVELTNQIAENEKVSDELIEASKDISSSAGDMRTKGHVAMCAGTIAFQRYMDQKLESLPSQLPIPRWLRWVVPLLREYRVDEYLLYDSHTRRRMRALLAKNQAQFAQAARIFKSAGEDKTAAYAFYNLANNLRSAYRFGAATRYLNQARDIAEKYNDERLLKGIGLLEKSIKAKNTDTPDYAAGERRPSE
jgi:hypothetical protein